MSPAGAPRRLAVLDIGTNSVRLLGVEARPGASPRPLLDIGAVTRLGAGLAAGGRILPADLARTASALRRCMAAAAAAGIADLEIAGTEVFRAAANGPAAAAELSEFLGRPVRILSEQEEATAAYRGATAWPGTAPPAADGGERFVIDVGGGSSEVVLGRGPEVLRWKSLPTGALRLTEEMLPGDPPASSAIAGARARLERLVGDGLSDGFPDTGAPAPVPAIAVGGTASAVGAWVGGARPGRADRVEGTRVSAVDLRGALDEWSGMDLVTLVGRSGMSPGRARLVVGGGLILESIVSRLGLAGLTVSLRGLRHGLLARRLAEHLTGS